MAKVDDLTVSLDRLARLVQRRLKKDWDLVVAITGEEGVGKSTLSKLLAKRIDKNYTMEKNMLFRPTVKEMREKIKNLERYSVIDADEAIKILYKLNWQSRGQKYLNELYALARRENKTTFLCIPRFQDLNEYFRNHRVKMWIHVVARGWAVVDMKDPNKFAKDPWHNTENFKIFEKNTRSRSGVSHSLDSQLTAYSKTRNFVGIINFPDLPEEMKEEYARVRSRSDLDEYEEIEIDESQYRKQRDELVYFIYRRLAEREEGQKRLTHEDIGEVVELERSTISKIISSKKKEKLKEKKRELRREDRKAAKAAPQPAT